MLYEVLHNARSGVRTLQHKVNAGESPLHGVIERTFNLFEGVEDIRVVHGGRSLRILDYPAIHVTDDWQDHGYPLRPGSILSASDRACSMDSASMRFQPFPQSCSSPPCSTKKLPSFTKTAPPELRMT